MPGHQVKENDIQEIVGRLHQAAERRIRTTKKTDFHPDTKTYIHRVRGSVVKRGEITTTWGDGVLDKGFTLVPNVLLENYIEIGMRDKHLVLVEQLLRFGHKTGQCYPAQKTLANRTGYGIKTVQRLLRELKEMGFLEIYKRYIKPENENPRRTSNVYDLRGLMEKLQQLVSEKGTS